MTPLERALDLSYPAFAILHQHGRFSGPPHQRVCEAILGDLRIARRQEVRGVILEIFSRDEQVMGLLLPDSGPPQLLGFDDRTMMYEGDCQGLGGQGALAWRSIAPLNPRGCEIPLDGWIPMDNLRAPLEAPTALHVTVAATRRREVRHPWDGVPHRLTIYFATLD
jgi:hypothetical protein